MSYVFDPKVLHEIAKSAVGLPREEAFDHITRRIDERYPDQIFTGPRHFVFNNAGGAMGQLSFLYGSLSEYILLFGTPIGTEGHSGRYIADVHDFVFEGEMWCYEEGDSVRKTYKPGDHAFLGGRRTKGYRIPDSAYMLEYARGPIPLMIPFGLADTMVSTLDMKCARDTLTDYGKLVIRSLWKSAKERMPGAGRRAPVELTLAPEMATGIPAADVELATGRASSKSQKASGNAAASA